MTRLVLQLILALWTGAHTIATVFDDANRLYEQGQYAEAIPLYQNLLKSGHHSPGVLFNLGNAYFKTGELGRAIYQYRRAQQIAPRDPDIQANLRFARDRVAGAISIQLNPIARFLRYFSLNELALSATLVFWVWMALLCLGRARPNMRPALRPYVTIAAILFIFANVVLVAAYYHTRQAVAIIAQRQATVRLGPLDESQPAFTASDGAELRILARREDWLQVEDRSGRTGWLHAREALLFSAL